MAIGRGNDSLAATPSSWLLAPRSGSPDGDNDGGLWLLRDGGDGGLWLRTSGAMDVPLSMLSPGAPESQAIFLKELVRATLNQASGVPPRTTRGG